MWVMIDNYDSFTYILLHYIQSFGINCVVFRNDEITLSQLIDFAPKVVVISPGPATPRQSGITMDVIAHFFDKIPVLGVCLGHQALGLFFGATLVKAPYPMHGKTSTVVRTEHPLFKGVPNKFKVMRYHSLILENIAGTPLLNIAQTTDTKINMAIAHPNLPIAGIQFHPESVGTEYGLRIIENWVQIVSEYYANK
jgi:anthranilate synthase/aminodeoxychorismate synthase-like glutamine amidotransferase